MIALGQIYFKIAFPKLKNWTVFGAFSVGFMHFTFVCWYLCYIIIDDLCYFCPFLSSLFLSLPPPLSLSELLWTDSDFMFLFSALNSKMWCTYCTVAFYLPKPLIDRNAKHIVYKSNKNIYFPIRYPALILRFSIFSAKNTIVFISACRPYSHKIVSPLWPTTKNIIISTETTQMKRKVSL